MLSWGIIANDESIKKKPKAMKAFMTVLARSWKHILDGGLDEAVQSMIKLRPNARVSMAAGKGIFNAYRPYFYSPTTKGKPMGYMSEKDWADTVTTLKGLEAGQGEHEGRPTSTTRPSCRADRHVGDWFGIR